MSRAAVEASRTGNPFTEKNLLIARVDQLSRSEELMANIQASEREDLEGIVIDAATAAATAEELEAEIAELKELVRLADGLRRSGVDAKWLQMRDLLRSDRFAAPAPSGPSGSGLDSDGNLEPVRKLIVFSEHKDTLDYVADRIASELGRPEAVVRIHGGIKRHDRRAVQDRFRVDPTVRVLVATDAAGEGVNLQVAKLSRGAVPECEPASSPDQRPAERRRTAQLRRPPAITPRPQLWRCSFMGGAQSDAEGSPVLDGQIQPGPRKELQQFDPSPLEPRCVVRAVPDGPAPQAHPEASSSRFGCCRLQVSGRPVQRELDVTVA